MKRQAIQDDSSTRARKAFQDWLAASDAWLKLYRRMPMVGEGARVAKKRLRALEKRVEAAADAFEQVHRGLD